MRPNGKRLVVGVAAVALLLAGCSTSNDGTDTGAGATNGKIIVANSVEPQRKLIPAETNETGGGKIIDLIFAGLIRYDIAGTTHNEVAESIETTDGQTYTVTLKDDQIFSDGTPIKAENFVKAWNVSLANKYLATSFYASIEGYDPEAKEMSGLQVVDDKTFTIKLSQPEEEFPLQLGYSAFFPLPDSAFEDLAAFGENPIGNGPYKLAEDDAWIHHQKISLVVNDKYTGDLVPKNGGIDFIFYDKQEAAYADVLAGNLDVLDQLPDSAFATYETDFGDRAVNQPAAIFQSFTIPTTVEHFSGEEGKLRRQALSMSIDRNEITKQIFNDTRTPAKDFTTPVLAGWNGDLPGAEVLEFNPTKAKELWAQANAIAPYDEVFTISYNSDGGHKVWVDAVCNSIKNNLGVQAEGNAYPAFPEYREAITNRDIPGAIRSGWQADYPSLYNFLGPLYMTGASANDGDYSNPEVDALFVKALGANNRDETNELLGQAQQILLQDLPAIPLWYANITGGSADTVENVKFNWKSVPDYTEITKK